MLPADKAATYDAAKPPVTTAGRAAENVSFMSVLAHEMTDTPAMALPNTAVHSR